MAGFGAATVGETAMALAGVPATALAGVPATAVPATATFGAATAGDVAAAVAAAGVAGSGGFGGVALAAAVSCMFDGRFDVSSRSSGGLFSSPHLTVWADLLQTQTCYSCYTRHTQAQTCYTRHTQAHHHTADSVTDVSCHGRDAT